MNWERSIFMFLNHDLIFDVLSFYVWCFLISERLFLSLWGQQEGHFIDKLEFFKELRKISMISMFQMLQIDKKKQKKKKKKDFSPFFFFSFSCWVVEQIK